MKLSNIAVNHLFQITKLDDSISKSLLFTLGLSKGKQIKKIKQTPWNGPDEFYVDGNYIAIRKSLCDKIIVTPIIKHK